MRLKNLTPLVELRTLDTAPKSFLDFLKKYRKLQRERRHETYGMYVNFTNMRDSVDDKNAADPNGSHDDPKGIYTYPMDYVLKHPADLWYGMNTRHMFVIQSTAKNVLELRLIDSNNAINRFRYRIGLQSYDDRFLNKIRRTFNYTGRGRFAKTFMSSIQIEWEKMTPEEIKKRDWKLMPNAEQTKLFTKAYDVIIDEGTGAINGREPEQAIFLKRSSFKVIDKFELRKDVKKVGSIIVKDHGDNLPLMRKIAQAVAEACGDNITKGPKHNDVKHMYWTRTGMRIKLGANDTSLRRRMDTTKIGSKPHKWFKGSDAYVVSIEVHTPYGIIEDRIGYDEKFKDAFLRVGREFHSIKSNSVDPDWEPENLEKYLAKVKEDKELDLWNRIRVKRDLPEIDYETMRRMESEGRTPIGYFTLVKVNEMRREAGLREWDFQQYGQYRDGKIIDPLYQGQVGPSDHSKERLRKILINRWRGKPGEEDVDHEFKKDFYHDFPHNAVFGPRSLAYVNGLRKKKGLPPISPEQYARYRQSPDQVKIDKYFPESRLVTEKFQELRALPDDWTAGMWVKPETDQYALADGLSHVTMIAINPVKFGLPNGAKGTPFEHYHKRLHQAIHTNPMEYRNVREEMSGDDNLKKFMCKHGWVRTFGDEGSLEVEAHTMKNVQSLLQWFAMHGVDIWGISGLDTWGDGKHLTNLDGEQVERILNYGNVKRRLGEEFVNVRSAYAKENQFPLPFDQLVGRAFRITDPKGDAQGEGYSIVTPFNRLGWNKWEDRPSMYPVAKVLFTNNAVPEPLWNQIHDAAVRLGLIDRMGKILENDDRQHEATLQKTGFFGKQAAGSIVFCSSTGRFLLPLRSKDVEEPHTWGTWGGAMDSGENPEAAARRELKEECHCSNIEKMIPAFVFKHENGFRYFNFIAVVKDEFRPVLNYETERASWVEYGKWPYPLHPGLKALLDDAETQNTMKQLLRGVQS